ncbi:substrate-binding domain-containing protein [Sphingomonas sp. DT-204]|uniref:substrate-binding domain-containing protein n=1 Tax=Sphingomonas sp. DT-204 TaxID=3396166 RepID=UPI003F1D8371
MDLIVPGDFLFLTGAMAAERLMSQDRPPTAVLAANDGMALGVMSAAKRRGLNIPHDLAVAGFSPTTISQAYQRVGFDTGKPCSPATCRLCQT